MPEQERFFWLFFRFTGRVNRAVYILGFFFMTVIMSFPLYQLMRVPVESDAARVWSLIFGATVLGFIWIHIAFSVKRLHDIDRPGLISVALFIPVVSIVAFVALCVIPGTPGPNRYGYLPNAPAEET